MRTASTSTEFPARSGAELGQDAAPDGLKLSLLNFGSYNYLGYSEAAKAVLDQYGLGACSSPVQAGTLGLHTILEERLAEFIGLLDIGVSLFSLATR